MENEISKLGILTQGCVVKMRRGFFAMVVNGVLITLDRGSLTIDGNYKRDLTRTDNDDDWDIMEVGLTDMSGAGLDYWLSDASFRANVWTREQVTLTTAEALRMLSKAYGKDFVLAKGDSHE